MEWGVKYRGEFTDILGLDWRLDIEKDGYEGSINKLQFSGVPIIFDHLATSDNVFSTIRGIQASFTIYSDIDFQYIELSSVDDLQFRVKIYNSAHYWTGYIIVGDYSEPYEGVSYPVTVRAACGLGILKNKAYDNEGDYYLGHRYESQVILDCLEKIGFTEFKEFINVYENTTDNTVDDSPLDQVLLDSFAFRNYSCYEVLEEVLKKYNAYITQKDGVFHIIRPKELTGATVYGRYFIAYNDKSSVTITPEQYINRPYYESDRYQIPGGTLMIQPPLKDVYVNHDYGNRESWMLNHNFDGNTYLYDTFEDWKVVGAAVYPVGGAAVEENQGCQFPYNYFPAINYIYQSFGENSLLSTEDLFIFEFDYMFYNGSSTIDYNAILKIKIKSDDGAYWLKEDNVKTCSWTNVETYISITTDIPIGETGWTNWKRTITGLPIGGSYTITLYPLFDSQSNVWLGIKGVRWVVTSVELSKIPVQQKRRKKIAFFIPVGWELINRWKWEDTFRLKEIKEKQYTASNPINGSFRSTDVMLGDVVDDDIDNVPNQFTGALATNAGSPQQKTDEVVVSGDYGYMNITCKGLKKQCMFDESISQTIVNFVDNYCADYEAIDITLYSGADSLFFRGETGVDFSTSVEQVVGTINGTVIPGSAYVSILNNTKSWSTRNNSEQDKLLQINADETAYMYNRPKQLIQYPIYETAKDIQVNTLGNFQDALNLYSGIIRIFCMNKGSFDVRDRKWEIDLFEIGTGSAPVTFQVIYGFQYNWFAVDDPKYICAAGWHVPTLSNYQTLETYLGGAVLAGGKLKETGLIYWNTPNTDATNEVGFNGRGAGNRNSITGSFAVLKSVNFLWCSGANNNVDLHYNSGTLYSALDVDEQFGYSVRPIKDSTILEHGETGTYTGNDGKVYNTICIGTQEHLACNLCETKYRDGSPIPNVTENAAWVALTTGAYCAYDNDIDNAYIIESPILSATADSTLVTVDSTIITSDSI